MSPEVYKWTIELVQSRYARLGLSFAQAELVHQFEEEKDIYSEKYYFSPWEEWDYSLSRFREILQAEQLLIYEADMREGIQRFEASLAEQDELKKTEIAFQEATIQFYETKLLPDLLNPVVPMFVALRQEVSKVEYLKKEYQVCLREAKKETLVNHFRFNRTFSPAALQVAMLQHKMWSLLPDYSMFKHRMDAPTKAVATFVEQKVTIMLDETKQLIRRKFAELKAFQEARFKQRHGDAEGWHVVRVEESEEAEMVRCAMSVLLLERGGK